MLEHNKIDQFLIELEKASDDDELRRIFATYNAEYDLNVSSDPYSDQYRKKQFDLYESLAKKSYSPQNEVTTFDVQAASISPFPYCHGSCDTVGNQLMGIGYVIKALQLPKGAKILEFGPGWGNTTIALAKMGFDVTAVDIEKNFCTLIEERSALEKIKINVIHSDFNYMKSIDTQFDAILFFECFHHADNHLELMAEFDRLLKPGGLVCFGAEPIKPDFPLPWGLRMDGESLWAISKNGWLELGYNQTYFENTMNRFGWGLTFYNGVDGSMSSAIIAKRLKELGGEYTFKSGGLKTQIGRLNDNGDILTTGVFGCLVYGPYIALPKGSWHAEFFCDEDVVKSGKVILDVTCSVGTKVLATQKIDLAKQNLNTSIAIDFLLEESTVGIEVRVHVATDTCIGIKQLKILYRSNETAWMSC